MRLQGLLLPVRLSNPVPQHETPPPSARISSLLYPHNLPAVLRESSLAWARSSGSRLTLWSSSEPLIQIPSSIGEDLSVDRRARYVSVMFPPTLSSSPILFPSVHVSSQYAYPSGLPSLAPSMPDRSYSYHHISNSNSYYDPRVPRQLPDHRQQQYHHVPSISNHIDPIDSFVSPPLFPTYIHSCALTLQSAVPYGSGEKPGTFPF